MKTWPPCVLHSPGHWLALVPRFSSTCRIKAPGSSPCSGRINAGLATRKPGSLQVRQTHRQHAWGKNGERQAHHLTGGHGAHVGAGSGGGHLLPSSGQLGGRGQGAIEGPRSRSQRVGLHAGKVESPVWLWRGWGSGTSDPHPARPRASRSPASCPCTGPAGWGQATLLFS